jgi:hypothetical protein
VVWRAPPVAASLGPAGIKPTEAKKLTVGLVPNVARLSEKALFFVGFLILHLS